MIDPTGRFLRANAVFLRLSGCSEAELGAKTFGDLAHPEDAEAAWNVFEELVQGRRSHADFESRMQRRSGQVISVRHTLARLADADGRLRCMLAMVEDITDRRFAYDALRESEARLRLVAHSVPALISYVDREQRYRFSNRTYDDWFGISHERMRGRTVAEVFGEDVHVRMKPHIERVLAGEQVEFEFSMGENAATGGRNRSLQVACVPHLAPDGAVLGFYMLGNDVTALKRAQEDLRFAAIQLQHDARRLEFLAHHDTLTGLPNRAMFHERAREAVAHARRHDKTAAVLFIDLDNFKQVNDGLGHDVGDGLLKVIASRLRACVRGDDFIARIGGDEFCVLLQEIAEPREAAAVAQKLVYELSKAYRIGEHSVSSGASVGIACVPQDGHDVATPLRPASLARYMAASAFLSSVSTSGPSCG
jgi:diguanylate cyclase (GGDEF)-like protein/PAS domain S-box-containing protein